MDLKKTRIDSNLATDGVWVPLDDSTQLRIAKWLNERHKKYLQKALDPYKRALQFGTMDESVAERIEIEALANTVLVGWEGLLDGGKPVEYSAKEAVRLLSDPELGWFRDFVREQAQELANFREKALEAEVEAVGKRSSGSSAGVRVASSS